MAASRRILGWSLFTVAAFAVIGCGEAGTTVGSRPQKLAEPYPFTVEKRDLVGYTMLDRPLLYVPPESQAVIYPKYQAPVEQVMTSVGQRVNKGEVLVQLSFPSADAAYDQTQADLKAAEAAYAAAKREYEAPLREARQALEQARKIEREQRVIAANGDASGLEQARMQREAAEAAVTEAENYLRTNIASSQSMLESARDAVKQAQQGVKMGSLRAPISGTVTFLDVRPGEVVGDDARKQLVKIVDLGDIKVKAYVPSDFSASLKQGDEVTLAFDELPNRVFTGKLTKIAVVRLDMGTGRELTIDFQNDQGLIKEGFQPSWAGVKVGEAKDVLAVPNEAIKIDPTGKPVVNVMEDKRWLPRIVEKGMTDGKYTQIKSGLKEGETVQVTPGKE